MTQPNAMTNLSNILFFSLSTLNLFGLVLYFVGSCIAEGASNRSLGMPWFLFVFYLCTYALIAVAFLTNKISQFKLAIIAFLAIVVGQIFLQMDAYFITLRTVSANIAFPDNGFPVIIAGDFFIIFSTLAWIFFIGAEEAMPFGPLNSKNEPLSQQHAEQVPMNASAANIKQYASSHAFIQAPTSREQLPLTSAHLNNKPVQREAIQPTSLNTSIPASTSINMDIESPKTILNMPPVSPLFPALQETHLRPGVVCKCVALYSYSADPNDPKEISFAKGDVFEVLDNGGKWWQARKDGEEETGIIPSNCKPLLSKINNILDMKIL